MWKTTFRSVNVTNMLRIKVKICVTAMNNPQNYLDHIIIFLNAMSHFLLTSALRADEILTLLERLFYKPFMSIFSKSSINSNILRSIIRSPQPMTDFYHLRTHNFFLQRDVLKLHWNTFLSWWAWGCGFVPYDPPS